MRNIRVLAPVIITALIALGIALASAGGEIANAALYYRG